MNEHEKEVPTYGQLLVFIERQEKQIEKLNAALVAWNHANGLHAENIARLTHDVQAEIEKK